jgi:hypothetical protein
MLSTKITVDEIVMSTKFQSQQKTTVDEKVSLQKVQSMKSTVDENYS